MPDTISPPADLPFYSLFEQFLIEFAQCPTYWYTPKARTLNETNLGVAVDILRLLNEHLEAGWTVSDQRAFLTDLHQRGLTAPYTDDQSPNDEAAHFRILRRWLEELGLAWHHPDADTIVITEAGTQLVEASDAGNDLKPIIETQVLKLQYPNPKQNNPAFRGLLPYVFLLLAMQRLDWYITFDELKLFINLAQGMDDLERIVSYVEAWRNLHPAQRDQLLDVVRNILRPEKEQKRFTTIDRNSPYQRAFFTYPGRLHQVSAENCIVCPTPYKVESVLQDSLDNLAIPSFRDELDWITYYGDPAQKPNWHTRLSIEIDRADNSEDAEEILKDAETRLEVGQHQSLRKRQREKFLEDYCAENPDLVESGLQLVEGGRQYPTATGPIDLLCVDQAGCYVVVEIKVDEAGDSAFGQLLRYMAWVHVDLPEGRDNVRGILLAGDFPLSARYSRLGLLRSDADKLIQFRRHGLGFEEA
jgi:hypothetical protein